MQAGGQDPVRFRIAEWEVDPATNRVSREQDDIKLEPKVMDVLVFLAGRPGQTASRQELEAAVWTGTVVGYDAVTGAIQKLRKVFDDDPARPQYIETLSKKGYRLIAPVSSLPADPQPAGAVRNDQDTNAGWRRRRVAVVAVLVCLLLVAAGLPLRIVVELIDAHSGDTLWADSIDDRATRLFEPQDRITHRIRPPSARTSGWRPHSAKRIAATMRHGK